jgi:hypothetical protein
VALEKTLDVEAMLVYSCRKSALGARLEGFRRTVWGKLYFPTASTFGLVGIFGSITVN